MLQKYTVFQPLWTIYSVTMTYYDQENAQGT